MDEDEDENQSLRSSPSDRNESENENIRWSPSQGLCEYMSLGTTTPKPFLFYIIANIGPTILIDPSP